MEHRHIIEGIGLGFCIVEVLFDDRDRPFDYRFLKVNEAFEAQTGLHDPVGKTMRTLRPDHEPHWYDIYGKVALTGERTRFERPATALGRWYDVWAFRIGVPEQRRVAIVFEDISDRKREEERVALLATEINHRAINVMSVLASMVRVTKADSVPEFREKLLARITSLSNSQRLLSESQWQRGDLVRLVADEMAAYAGSESGRIAWRGPAVALMPVAVQALGLALHELATNAAKYGALSVPQGRVSISWDRPEDRSVVLTWRESGGPSVTAPGRRGTGTRVVLAGIQHQLSGRVDFDWRTTGLACTLRLPPSACAPE